MADWKRDASRCFNGFCYGSCNVNFFSTARSIIKVFFRIKLNEWKKELVKANNEALYNGSMDDNSISADIVDQASSYTDKNVEMKAINRQIKLISEIDKALMRIRDETYGYCLDTAEPIGLKRLMARPVAKYTIAAQEKHEKNEKVHADD